MRRMLTKTLFLAAFLTIALAQSAAADLTAVSGFPNPAVNEVPPGGDPTQVAISLANGFPLWYRDDSGLKLELCLQPPTEIAPGVMVDPCELGLPFPGAPPSFPNNFGSEALYWAATVFGNYTSTGGSNSSALLVLAQEAGFAAEGPIADGNQAVFSRIRIRVDVPVAGTYRVTHPFGNREYVVTTPGVRAINQSQDKGLDVPRDWIASMVDGPAPVEPLPFVPSVSAGIVNQNGESIGPFLVPSQAHGGVLNPAAPATFAGGPLVFNGAGYIGLPFAPNLVTPALPLDVFQPVTAGLDGVDYFEIELLDPAPGFLLDAAGIDGNVDNTVRFSNFQLIGKIFDDGPNLAPVALPDSAATSIDTAVSIDVVANDLDAVAVGNVHGLNPQAVALVHPDTAALVLTQSVPTAQGGTVRRTIVTQTGQTSFRYTPPSGYTGTDTFTYVLQDTGGLVSPPATVTVTVEELTVTRADYRPKTGKWHIAGTSSDGDANTVTLLGGPRATLTGSAEVPAVVTAAAGAASLRISSDAIDFALRVEPLPPTAVTAAHIHVGPAGANGPVIFFLYDGVLEAPFAGSKSGTLTGAQFIPRPAQGINTFADALAAILAGNAYVNIHTSANSGGEIRGQLQMPLLGTATVDPVSGVWVFEGKVKTGPGLLPGVSVESANGIRVLGTPLRLR